MQLKLYDEENRIRQGQAVTRRHQYLIWAAGLLLLSAIAAFFVGSLFATQILTGLVTS